MPYTRGSNRIFAASSAPCELYQHGGAALASENLSVVTDENLFNENIYQDNGLRVP